MTASLSRSTPPVGAAVPQPAPAAVLHVGDLRKTYGRGRNKLTALDGVTIGLPTGSFTALMGPSGSGKSTFLKCVSGLDRPDSGSVWLGEVDLPALSESALTKLRRSRVGFVFQDYNLMPALTAAQNIRLPSRLAGHPVDRVWLHQVIEATELAPLLNRRPTQLSGGQQQRVALARALVGRPDIIFADEPTGALDSRTGREILTLLRYCVTEFGQTVLMVTHDPAAAVHADTTIFMRDGRLSGGLSHPSIPDILEVLSSWGRS